MNKRVWNFGIGLALIALGYAAGHHSTTVVHAEDASQIGHNIIPRNWGHVAAATGNFLVLEDDQGNINLYNFYTHQSMGYVSRKP